MHQRRYALEILKKFEIEHCNVAITAGESRLQLSKNEVEQDVNPIQYRRLIGSLCYLCNTQSYLEFSVNIVRRFMMRPKVSHLATVKRILGHVKGSIGYRVLFPAMDKGKKCDLLGFTNSN